MLPKTLRESESVQVQVYNLNGKRLLNQAVTLAEVSQLRLSERLANGVYMYRLTVRNSDGSEPRSELKKLLIQR